jgi:Holliday junction resolvasome RuvABC DNA-binding subunit
VKELTRVVTPTTEAQWLACARGRNVRDIEALVAGHKKGDLPTDPKDPALLMRDVVFRLDARRQALLQQARAMFEAERGESIDNAALIEALCMSALQHGDSALRVRGVGRDASDGAGGMAPPPAQQAPVPDAARDASDSAGGAAPPPAHQVVVRTCEDCNRAWMPAHGTMIEITRGDQQAMECDAEIVREADIEAAQAIGKRRPAPTLTIPEKTRDLVWSRDEGRCQFPGCRAARHLAIHHIWFREHGGSHDAWNLLLLCDGHHKALHDGMITITGRAPDQLEFTRDGKRLVAPRSPASMQAAAELQRFASPAARPTSRSTGRASTRFEDVVKLEQATQALRQLGYKTRVTKRALEKARAHVDTDADVPALVKAVLDLGREWDARSPIARAESETDVSKLARQALVQSGFAAAIADAAVARARAHVGTDVELAALIKAALRYCRD